MFGNVALAALFFLFLEVETTTDPILPPPQNLSLRWISPFEPEISWNPPQPSMGHCTYLVEIQTSDPDMAERSGWSSSRSFSVFLAMEGGYLQWSVIMRCNGKTSKPAVFQINDTELVKDLECYLYTATKAHCSWSREQNLPDLRFFFQLIPENEGNMTNLLECSHRPDGERTGCDLQATTYHSIYILFNGTLRNTSVRNTFNKKLKVKPPALRWNVNKDGNTLDIQWEEPEITSFWEYKIIYTECDKTKNFTVKELSYRLHVAARCPYCIAVVAESNEGGTPLNRKCFDAEGGGLDLVYVAVIVPSLLACVAALAFTCYWKKKDDLLPKVPQPRDLLSEIHNNSKSVNVDLYRAAEEEVSCEVRLVADTQTNTSAW